MNEVIEILRKEQRRIAQMLPTLDPATDGYCRAISNFGDVTWKLSSLDVAPDFTPAPAPVPVDAPPVPAEEPVHTPEPEPAPAPVEEPKAEATTNAVDWEKYRIALRERMAEARLNGLNTTELIAAMGVGKYSAVPDDKLPELSDLLDKALKEKG